jgi:putative membrane protein
MAWMRTSVSLFTFGFSITKFIDYLGQRQEVTQFSEGIYRLGFVLVCLGILGLIFAGIEHVHRIRRAKELGLPTISRFSLPIAATVTLLLIGITTLLLSF